MVENPNVLVQLGDIRQGEVFSSYRYFIDWCIFIF